MYTWIKTMQDMIARPTRVRGEARRGIMTVAYGLYISNGEGEYRCSKTWGDNWIDRWDGKMREVCSRRGME